jgi:hypothetical protein
LFMAEKTLSKMLWHYARIATERLTMAESANRIEHLKKHPSANAETDTA